MVVTTETCIDDGGLHRYVSTYCQHALAAGGSLSVPYWPYAQHQLCRRHCKVCHAPCRCPCHVDLPRVPGYSAGATVEEPAALTVARRLLQGYVPHWDRTGIAQGGTWLAPGGVAGDAAGDVDMTPAERDLVHAADAGVEHHPDDPRWFPVLPLEPTTDTVSFERGTRVRLVVTREGRPPLWMGHARRGQVTHLTPDREPPHTSLCGRRLEGLVVPFGGGEPVPYADHWAEDALIHGGSSCASCATRVRELRP